MANEHDISPGHCNAGHERRDILRGFSWIGTGFRRVPGQAFWGAAMGLAMGISGQEHRHRSGGWQPAAASFEGGHITKGGEAGGLATYWE